VCGWGAPIQPHMALRLCSRATAGAISPCHRTHSQYRHPPAAFANVPRQSGAAVLAKWWGAIQMFPLGNILHLSVSAA
jgi:hypothetical protein